MLTLRWFMVLSIKIDLEGILGLTLFKEAHKHDVLVNCYLFYASTSCFLDVQNYFYVNQFWKRWIWFQFHTGMKLEKMKSHTYISTEPWWTKLQPFLLCEANCAHIMWKRKNKNQKKWCEVEIHGTGWIGMDKWPISASLLRQICFLCYIFSKNFYKKKDFFSSQAWKLN
jgi:hypothetical protein